MIYTMPATTKPSRRTMRAIGELSEAVLLGFVFGVVAAYGNGGLESLAKLTGILAAVVVIALGGAAMIRSRWRSVMLITTVGLMGAANVIWATGINNGAASDILFDLATVSCMVLIYLVSGCPRGGCIRADRQHTRRH